MSAKNVEPTASPEATVSALERPAIAAVGGILGGIASISCCVLPLVFVLVGISGAWIGNLTALSRWQPAFIAIAAGFIVYGHWSAYRPHKVCRADGVCARPLPRRLVGAGLWTGTALVAVGVAVAYLLPLVMD
jgi:mercuric ion transport protein